MAILDQNTDRLWYVIGAVLIGAAIVLLLNGTVPDLFAQVAGSYEEKTEEATNAIENGFGSGKEAFDFNWERNKSLQWYKGHEITSETHRDTISGFIPVKPGEIYETSHVQFDPFFYDEDKQFIGSFMNNTSRFVVPEPGSVYMNTTNEDGDHLSTVRRPETPAYMRVVFQDGLSEQQLEELQFYRIDPGQTDEP